MQFFATLVALCVAPQSETLTFVHEPAPVGRVVARLAEQTGAKLGADASLTEVVFVHASDVRLSDLKARIAQVARCRWSPAGEGREVLVPDEARRRSEVNQAEAKHRATIAETLSRWAKEDPAQDEFRGAFGMFGGMFGPMSDSLAKACALAVGASALGTVGQESRLVWATDPTSSQLVLNVPGLEAMVAQAIEKHNAALDEADFDQTGEQDPKQAEAMQQMAAMVRALGIGKKVEGKPAKVCFIATRDVSAWFGRGLSLEARVFDTAGNLMLSSSAAVGELVEPIPEAEAEGGAEPTGQAAQPEGATWQLSEEALQFQEALDGSIRAGDTSERAAALRKALTGVGERDLLAYGVGEALENYAKAVGANVVAWLPDSSFRSLGTQTSRAGVETAFRPGADLQKAADSGWVTISPSDPVTARRQAFFREDLAALATTAVQRGRPGLDALARYAVRNPEPEAWGPAGAAIRALGAGREGFLQDNDYWLVLRLYGSLSTGQRQGSAQAFSLTNGAWSPLQRRTVSQWVFGPNPQLTAQLDYNLIAELGRELPFGAGGRRELALEPTAAAPGGLASLGAVLFERTNETCFRPVSSGQGGLPDSVGIEEMALLQYILDDEAMRKSIESDEQLPRTFLVGKRSVVTVRIQVGPGAFAVGRLTDDSFDAAAVPVGIAELPEADLARMKSIKAELEKGPFGVFFKLMGGMRDMIQPETPPPGE
jgi:hypothetical protein